jgi:exodeoxyribonuclease VII small subunit
MTTKKPLSFEKSLERLEIIAQEMENADPDLDKAFALFNEGIELVKFCSDKLNETKKKIEILVGDNEKIAKKEFGE